MNFTAVARNARISPRKATLSAALIRGKRVEEALNLLAFELRRGSAMLKKVLESAIANAADQGGIDPMDLVVVEARVNSGFTIKRWRPASRGRVAARKKRSSHIHITVARGETKPAKTRAKKAPKSDAKA
jgi:large subunit ribosomal protein L22